MPELPEVETVANGVHARIAGDRIDDVWFSSKPEPMKSPPAAMAEALTGRTIERVHRVGKHIVFDLGSDESAGEPTQAKRSSVQAKRGSVQAKRGSVQAQRGSVQWIVHLGMTGRLLVSDANVPRPPHTHGVLALRSGRELRFVDPRRFGRMGLHIAEGEPGTSATPARSRKRLSITSAPPSSTTGFTGPGIDPLHISPADFRRLFRGRRTPIKAALLNQSLLHGVGNIYADESLFRAGIRPRRMAARLNATELDRLHIALQAVLREAIALGGSSVSDYVDADGARGFFQLQHRVYMRTGEPCLVCGTPIRRIVLAGRGTHYCTVCQR
jgi:formamidopyrimidine-DNA glycosylase